MNRSGLYERFFFILMNTRLKQSILCMETGKKIEKMQYWRTPRHLSEENIKKSEKTLFFELQT